MFCRPSLFFHQNSKKNLDEFILKALLQAVVDDDIVAAKNILNVQPERSVELVDEMKPIQSKHHSVQYIPEPAFAMACRLKRTQILEMMIDASKKNPTLLQKQQDICISLKEVTPENSGELKALAKAIAEDKMVDGVLSEATAKKLNDFRKKLLPEKPVSIDQYPDTWKLLVEAYQHYHQFFGGSGNQDFFANHVIRLIQLTIPPMLARIYCHPKGLSRFVRDFERVSELIEALKQTENISLEVTDDSSNIDDFSNKVRFFDASKERYCSALRPMFLSKQSIFDIYNASEHIDMLYLANQTEWERLKNQVVALEFKQVDPPESPHSICPCAIL